MSIIQIFLKNPTQSLLSTHLNRVLSSMLSETPKEQI